MKKSAPIMLLAVAAALLLGCGSSDGANLAALSAAKQSDAQAQEVQANDAQGALYALCDGSEDVRLAISASGGEVDWSYKFTSPYGFQFLYVTGRCNFVASADYNQLRGWVEGTLTAEQAASLTDMLKLHALRGVLYRDPASCPDAPDVSVLTAEGYADCSCGCDDSAPSDVKASVAGTGSAFALIAQIGRPLDGPVEILAAVDASQVELEPGRVQAWPLSWPLNSIALTSEQALSSETDPAQHARTLVGGDAEAMRALRTHELARTMYASAMILTDGDQSYWFYVRDQIALSLQSAIATFHQKYDPNAPHHD